jgi:hypothetical protein
MTAKSNSNFLGMDFVTPLQSRSPLTNLILLLLWIIFSYIASGIVKFIDGAHKENGTSV